jgi:hypothetical protein
LEGTRVLLARPAETSAPDRFHGAEWDIGLSDYDRIAIDFASVNDLFLDGNIWTDGPLNQIVAPSHESPVA